MRSARDEKLFLQYEPMLHRLANSFHMTTGLDAEELFGEACVAFVESVRSYDESRGALPPRIWVCVSNRLKNYIKYQKRNFPPTEQIDEDFDLADPRDDIECQENMADIASRMVGDARKVLKVVGVCPLDFARLSRQAIRRVIIERLREEGWSLRRATLAVREVTKIMRSI